VEEQCLQFARSFLNASPHSLHRELEMDT
jgi:hypothetical protein